MKKIWKLTGAAAAVLAAVLFLYVTGIGCPIRFLTGIPCAGCGMTRAWLCFLRGDVCGAFAFHPLFLLMIPAGPVFLLQDRLPVKIRTGLAGLLIAVFLITWAVRLILRDPVLRIEPADGMIWKIILEVRNVL